MSSANDGTRAVYVISVAAELAGVHPQTLRNYERSGLPGHHPERTLTTTTTGLHCATSRTAGRRSRDGQKKQSSERSRDGA